VVHTPLRVIALVVLLLDHRFGSVHVVLASSRVEAFNRQVWSSPASLAVYCYPPPPLLSPAKRRPYSPVSHEPSTAGTFRSPRWGRRRGAMRNLADTKTTPFRAPEDRSSARAVGAGQSSTPRLQPSRRHDCGMPPQIASQVADLF